MTYWSYWSDHGEIPKSVNVNTRKVASNAANILRRCLKLGIMSSSEEERTTTETRFPMIPKIPKREVATPSIKNLTILPAAIFRSVSVPEMSKKTRENPLGTTLEFKVQSLLELRHYKND